MQYQKYLDTISTYELAMLDKDLTPSNFDTYMKKINEAREKLFYALADQAKKKPKLKEILINDELKFVQFETVLINNINLNNSQFHNCLTQMVGSYTDIKEFDENNEIFLKIMQKLREVLSSARQKNCTDRISSIVATLNEFYEKNNSSLENNA
jgi:hypothetical protein